MSNKLNDLVESGTIVSYQLRTFDVGGNDVSPGDPNRETDELTLVFPDGEVLTICTLCGDCEDNIDMLIGRKAAEK